MALALFLSFWILKMAKVKLTTSRVTGDLESQSAGQVIEVSDEEAKSLIAAGQAVEEGEKKAPRKKTKKSE